MENTEQVQSPQPQPSPVQPVEQKPYGKRKQKKLILIYIVLALCIYGGIYYFYLSKQGLSQYSSIYPSPTISKIQAAVSDPTANWKTYANENFSFKYPQDWEVKDLLKNDSKLDWLRTTTLYIGIRPQTLQVDARALLRVTTDSPEQVKSLGERDYDIEVYKGKTYIFNFPGDSENEDDKIAEKILSTFKFTDQTNTDTSNWRMYTNSELNVSLKLPPTWKASSSVKIIGDSFEFIVSDSKYNTDPKCLGDCPSFYIKFSMQENTSNQNLDSVVEALETKTHNKDAVISDILLDNYPAKRIDHLSGEAESAIYVIFKGKIYRILTVVYSDSKESQRAKNDLVLADQVLSTLKFTQ